ncbi:MAG: sensor histidine kinase [Chromatiales bacterium]
MVAETNIHNVTPMRALGDMRVAFECFREAYFGLAESHQHLEQWVTDLARELEISQRAQSVQEEGRKRLSARLSNLLQALPAGVVVLDGEGRISECNAAARDLLGALTTGQVWRDAAAEVFAPRWDDGHDISLKNGRRVNISTQPLEGEDGQILLIKDVTGTRGLLEELNRHRRLASMGEMAAALAHQIRTPLASATLYLSSLRTGRGDEAGRAKCVEQSLECLQHLERLVADMLLFARGGAFETAELPLAALLQELTADSEAQAEAGSFRIAVRDDAAGIAIRGNRDALVSALRNLIDNARQACANHGQLQIQAAPGGAETVVLRFVDDGPGIPVHLREAIFEPVFTTRMGGRGLGLAVTQAVVCAHGGEISLEDGDGRGSTFTVRLPALCGALAGAGSSAKQAASIGRLA